MKEQLKKGAGQPPRAREIRIKNRSTRTLTFPRHKFNKDGTTDNILLEPLVLHSGETSPLLDRAWVDDLLKENPTVAAWLARGNIDLVRQANTGPDRDGGEPTSTDLDGVIPAHLKHANEVNENAYGGKNTGITGGLVRSDISTTTIG